MSIAGRRGVCLYCGHDHGNGMGNPRTLELFKNHAAEVAALKARIAELESGIAPPSETAKCKESAVRVCFDRDRECGSNPASWCDTCPNHQAKCESTGFVATDKPLNTNVRATVGEVCGWCGGRGELGGWRAGEGWDSEKCPHCNGSGKLVATLTDAFQMLRKAEAMLELIGFKFNDEPRSLILGAIDIIGAADKGEASNTDQPCDAEKYECKPEDAQYQVVVDRRDLFAFLRAAWREGHSNKQNYSEGETWAEASDYAVAKIKAWKTMLPASRPDLTDGEILDIFVNTNGENKADYMCNVGRAIILASHSQSSATAKPQCECATPAQCDGFANCRQRATWPEDGKAASPVYRSGATDTGDKS